MVQNMQPLNRLAGIPIIRRWPGIPPEILVNYGELIHEIIKKYDLKPVSESVGIKARTTSKTAVMQSAEEWIWKNGGMKAAHVHFAGEVYVLNDAQWRQFTSVVMKDFSRKLAGAKNISFDNFVQVTDAVSGMM